MENKKNEKQLPEVFKELQEIRRRQAMSNVKNSKSKNTIRSGSQTKSQKTHAENSLKNNVAKTVSNNKTGIAKVAKTQPKTTKKENKNAKETKTQSKNIKSKKAEIKNIKSKNSRAQNIKTKNIKAKNKTSKKEEFNYDIYQISNQPTHDTINHKFNAVGAVVGILIFILSMTTIKSNYIFATSLEEEKEVIGTYEKNENPINIMECVSENLSQVVKKEIITEKVTIEREIEYIENSQLPKDEQIVIEEGKDGYKEVTYIRSYENEELIDQVIINDIVIEEALKSTIEVGTSEFLANNNVHIGDTMYTKEEIPLMSEPKDDANQICLIYQYIDLKLLATQEEWCKIIVDGIEGYVKSDFITSATVNPEIVEKSRLKRISLSLNFDMEINKPSGLTKEDFIKVLSGNIYDVNKIFENNAGLFYDIEQKYNINGLFLASIGIHESNWGNSSIARDKKNLFGYGAYDSSPYTSSVTFESYEYGIELLAKALSKYYINEPGTTIYDGEIAVGTYYNGPTISGVNVRYASDQNWSNRVYEIMTGLYEKLYN